MIHIKEVKDPDEKQREPQRNPVTHSFRLRPFRWVSMKITTGPTAPISRGVLRSLRSFPCSGTRIIPARSM